MTRSAQQTYIQRLGFQDKDRSNQRHGLACEYLFDRLLHERLIDKAQQHANGAAKSYTESLVRHLNSAIASYDSSKERLELYGGKDSYGAQHYKDSMEKAKDSHDRLKPIIEKLYAYPGPIDTGYLLEGIADEVPAAKHINVPIRVGNYVNGFADVLFDRNLDGRLDQIEFVDDEPRFWWTGPATYKCGSGGDVVLGEVKITPEPAENVIQQIAFYRQFISGIDRVIILVDYDAPTLKRLTKGSDIEVYRLGQKFEDWAAELSLPSIEEL